MSWLVPTKDYYGFPYIPRNLTPVPLGYDSAGIPGQWATDESYLYFCFAPNSWGRVAGSAFGTIPTIGTLYGRWIAQDLDLSLSNGGDVLSWSDESANAWTLTNANSAGNRPTFVKPASGINGRDAVANTTSQTGPGLSNGSIAFNCNSPNKHTFVLVFKYTGSAPTGDTAIMGVAGGLGGGNRQGMSDTNRWVFTVPSGGNFYTVNNSVTDNVWHWMLQVWDINATPKVAIYLDNPDTPLTWGNAPTVLLTFGSETQLYVGSSGTQNSNSQVAECIIWRSALTLAERNVVKRYMQNTYALP